MTPPRDFHADEQVQVELRCGWRARLLDDALIAEELQRIAASEVFRCKVRIHSFTVEVNHLHITLSQDFDGQDPAMRIGISAFQRNFASQSAKWLNGFLSLQGRLWERVYGSNKKTDAGQVLKSIAYTVMNPVKHEAVKRAEDYGYNGADVYFLGKPDGVITHVPKMLTPMGDTPGERAKAIGAMICEVWEEAEKTGDLLKAARNALERHAAHLDLTAWSVFTPVTEWLGEEAVARKREEVLCRERPRAKFKPRRAPTLAEVLNIRVVMDNPRPLGGAAWKEWHF